jgi:hypothetical protein
MRKDVIEFRPFSKLSGPPPGIRLDNQFCIPRMHVGGFAPGREPRYDSS